jgi:hypothetical protein
MVGAVAGTPGTLPTNYTVALGGLTQTIVGIGTENGLQYIDYRLSGTASSTVAQLNLEGTTQIAALNGQTWTFSTYLKTISGTPNNYRLGMIERNAVGTIIKTVATNALPTTTLSQFVYSRALDGGALVAFVQPVFYMTLTIGETYDFTIRIAAPQMELGAYATTFIPTTTAAVTRLPDSASKADVASLIGQTEGTIYFEINFLPTSEGIRTFFTLEGSVTNQFSGFSITTGNNNNEVRFLLSNYTLTAGRHKVAVTYNTTTGEGKLFVDGAIRGTVAFTGFLATIDRFSLGCRINPFASFVTDRPQNGSFGESFLVKTALSDAQCIEITTL